MPFPHNGHTHVPHSRGFLLPRAHQRRGAPKRRISFRSLHVLPVHFISVQSISVQSISFPFIPLPFNPSLGISARCHFRSSPIYPNVFQCLSEELTVLLIRFMFVRGTGAADGARQRKKSARMTAASRWYCATKKARQSKRARSATTLVQNSKTKENYEKNVRTRKI